MKVSVRVIPHARKNVICVEPDRLKVYVTATAVDGKANQALIALLAEHYAVRKSRVQIIRGLKSRHKIVLIEDERIENVTGKDQ